MIDENVSRRDLEAIVQTVVQTMEGALTPTTLKVYEELESIANFLNKAKSELAAIQPSDFKDTHIPAATDELDAVVASTEEATSKILDQAEKLSEVVDKAKGDVKKTIEESVTTIFEACNFQDLTGQRITKVVRTLKELDVMINRLVDVFGDEIEKYRKEHGVEVKTDAPKSEEERLLNGPQLPDEANDQSAIDAMFD